MLRSTKELKGYKLAAADGSIGKVKDFLFDEAQWTIRWMVADTGNWLPKRKVLISPITLGEPDWKSRLFPVRLTKSEIESSPDLGFDEPVSREYETRWFDHYGYPYYWSDLNTWGEAMAPGALFDRQDKAARIENPPEYDANTLRSSEEVMGYHLHANDGEVGHVEDFIMDSKPWTMRYLVVDTHNWLPGRKVLIIPDWITSIQWEHRAVAVDLTREGVKGSPEYNPNEPINREYEARLFDYYGRPVYWRNA